MAFIFGILASFFAFILQVIVWIFHPDLFALSTPITQAIFFSLLFLAFSEEVARVLFTRQYLATYAKNQLVWAALFFGIGFCTLEIALTFWSGFSFKVLGAAGFHLLASFFSFWWLQQSRGKEAVWILLFLLVAIHVCFNLIILRGLSL